MRESHQRRAVVLAFLLVGATIGGIVPLATAASVSPFTAQTDSQDGFSASVETYDGQIAVEDGVVSVSGSSTTDADVVVAFVGSRGTVVASALPVTGERFAATVNVAEIEEGFVDGVVLSSGSDETFGTPGDGPDSADDLVDYADDLGDRDLTQDQVREVLLEATVNGGGSDDHLVDVPFVLTEGDVRITDVVTAGDRQASGVQQVPAGEPMVVRGVTNRRPSGRLIEASLVDSDGDAVDVATVDDWDTDGVWSVELAVPDDATPGTYTVVADDGEQSARADVEIVAASAPSTVTTTATAEPTTTAGPTSTATATPTQTTTVAGSEPTPTPEPTPDPTTTETQSPGLGLLVALGALAVAALTLVGLREKRT